MKPQFFPFEKNAEGKWDVHRPCMDYWEHFEKILVRLGDMGIETDLFCSILMTVGAFP